MNYRLAEKVWIIGSEYLLAHEKSIIVRLCHIADNNGTTHAITLGDFAISVGIRISILISLLDGLKDKGFILSDIHVSIDETNMEKIYKLNVALLISLSHSAEENYGYGEAQILEFMRPTVVSRPIMNV